jgi:tetratricopeptide (TPR) repeat protein
MARWQGTLGQLSRHPVLGGAIILGCLGLTAAFAWAVVVPYFRAHSHWKQAQEALADSDFLTAREHLEECQAAWPTSAETSFLLARTCRRAGDFDAAREHLLQAGDLGWSKEQLDLEYLLVSAQQGLFEGDLERTLERFLETRQHPEEVLIFEALAKGYLHTYRLFEARSLLTAWIVAHPDHWQPRMWRATVLERLGKAEFDAARADYETVLELRPQHFEARLRLARVLLGIGQDHAGTARHFELYLAEHPSDPEALNGLARCRRALGQLDDARTLLERLVAANNRYGPGLVTFALLESDQENHEQALFWLRKAEEVGPNELDTVHHLAIVLRRLHKEAEAEEYEQKFRRLEADLRELDKATKRVATNPRDVSARHTAGVILIKVGKEQEGVRWLESALRQDPRHKPTHQALAEYYEGSKDPQLRSLAAAHRRQAQ